MVVATLLVAKTKTAADEPYVAEDVRQKRGEKVKGIVWAGLLAGPAGERNDRVTGPSQHRRVVLSEALDTATTD